MLRFFMGLDGVVAFEVVVHVTLSETERQYLRALVRFLKPAPTHFVRIVEPDTTTPHEAWELGRTELGPDAIA